MERVEQKISWDEETNQTYLQTKYSDGSIQSEKLTTEEAAQWQAENKF